MVLVKFSVWAGFGGGSRLLQQQVLTVVLLTQAKIAWGKLG